MKQRLGPWQWDVFSGGRKAPPFDVAYILKDLPFQVTKRYTGQVVDMKRTFRIAPDDGSSLAWRLDVRDVGIWEALTRDEYGTPEEAAEALAAYLASENRWTKNAGSMGPLYGNGGRREVSPMADDRQLRSALIRLAHAHPEFRQDILPLVTAGEVPEAFKEQWDKKKDEDSKDSKDDKAKEASDRTAGMAIIRRACMIQVRITQHKAVGSGLKVVGVMNLAFGATDIPTPIRFIASIAMMGDSYAVVDFAPVKPVTGSGSEALVGVLRSALQEAFAMKGASLLGSAADEFQPAL